MKRILWISDIHLNANGYHEKERRTIESFVKYLTDTFSPSDINIMVISGDIAFSGSDKKHYNLFESSIISPLKKHFEKLHIISVPGNHDVNWGAVRKEFLQALIDGNSLDAAIKEIGSDYFATVFLNYSKFHEKNVGEHGETFSYLSKVEEDILFICLNSSWLSIGNPVDRLEIVERKVNRISSLEFIGNKHDKTVLFHEIENQTYGFSLPKVKLDLEDLKSEILKKYKNCFKVLVVHHPPNNWLKWGELYSEAPNTNTDFHNFILDLNIDVILAGHEHTSLVEGGMIYGKTLVLHGGMFLDHKEESISPSWFKILEIEPDKPSNPSEIVERWFIYTHKEGGFWEEVKHSAVSYQNWNKICNKLSLNGSSTTYTNKEKVLTKINETLTLDDTTLRQLFEPISLDDERNGVKDKILEITGFKDSQIDPVVTRSEMRCYCDREGPRIRRLFIINNINDLFVNYVDKVPEDAYLCAPLKAIGESEEEVFIFYTAKFSRKLSDNQQDKIRELIQAKFEQFRFKIFKLAVCVEKLRNSKIAIRF
jgi:Icc-related predicted phosphoesterase